MCLGSTSTRGSLLLHRCARRSPTRPSNYRTALGCWKSKMPRATRRPLALLRTPMTSVHLDGLRAETYRVEGHVRRARYEIWSPTSCDPCRCGGAQGTSRCLEPMPVSCSTGSDAREPWRRRVSDGRRRPLPRGAEAACEGCCRSTAPYIVRDALTASLARLSLPSRGGVRGGC